MERKVCTIGEWLDVWYEVYAVPEYASKTLEIYRDARKRLSRRFRKSKAHFKVRWNSPRIAAHAAPYLRDPND